MIESFSRHLGASSELLVVADLKPGFVPVRATLTYATRLRRLLTLYDALRRAEIETSEGGIHIGAISRLRTLQFVRWSVFDDDRRMMLAVTFDTPLETYIRRIADVAGPLLDTILCHCVGYHSHSTDLGYEPFLEWAVEHRVDIDMFGAVEPNVSVDDIAYLKDLEKLHRAMGDQPGFDADAAKLTVTPPLETMNAARAREPEAANLQSLRIIRAMHYISDHFPPPADRTAATNDDLYLRRVTASFVKGFDPDAVKSEALLTPFGPALAWYGAPEPNDAPRPPAAPRRKIDLKNIQAGVVSRSEDMVDGAAKPMNLGALLLIRIDDAAPARDFLAGFDASNGESREGVRRTIAFTNEGLKTLGLPEAERRKLPESFREGMAKRCGLIGDITFNHPQNWEIPPLDRGAPQVHPGTVDMVIQLRTYQDGDLDSHAVWNDAHPLKPAADAIGSADGLTIVAIEPLLSRTRDGAVTGHFGLVDGLSQPKLDAPGDPDEIEPGELLLGHGPGQTETPALQVDGTFLVVRKLEQNVAGFEAAIGRSGVDRRELVSKMIGRDPSGVPVIARGAAALAPDDNGFDYANDADGAACPFQAHIRRANPRMRTPTDEEIRTPRIMRRGLSYGPAVGCAAEDEAERGLMFMAYNASIAEQFEVIQRWIAGGNGTGVYSGQSDALLGLPERGEDRVFRYREAGGDVARVNLGAEPFVYLRWGLYLFVPSIPAIRALGQAPEIGDAPDGADARDLLDRPRTEADWKRILEDDDPRNRDKADKIWAAVQSLGGAARATAGVLVTDPDLVRTVLQDGATFSVREYWGRMKASIGVMYLGLDPDPAAMRKDRRGADGLLDRDYEAEVAAYAASSGAVNELIQNSDPETLFRIAYGAAAQIFQHGAPREPDPVGGGERMLIDVEVLIAAVLASVTETWIGVRLTRRSMTPDGEPDDPPAPGDFIEAASYIFGPFPGETTRSRAERIGPAALAHARAAVKAPPPGTLLERLRAIVPDRDEAARLTAGLVMGFVSPATGAFVGAAFDWIDSGMLWRAQQRYLAARPNEGSSFAAARETLRPPLIASMKRYAAPNLIHRVATRGAVIGDVRVEPGERIILGVGPAARRQADGEAEMLFGGRTRRAAGAGEATDHACPGRAAGEAVMMGAFAALMEAGAIAENSALTVYIRLR